MFMSAAVCYSESMALADKALVKLARKRDLYDNDISPERTTDSSRVYIGLFSICNPTPHKKNGA